MLALARRGLIHVLASDAHSSHGGRPLRISEGIAALEEVEMLRPHLDWIAEEAPAAILRGRCPGASISEPSPRAGAERPRR